MFGRHIGPPLQVLLQDRSHLWRFEVPLGRAGGQQPARQILGLDPGEWALAARLDGFSTVEYPDIDIRIAANTTVEIEMPGVIEEVIQVTGRSPERAQRARRVLEDVSKGRWFDFLYGESATTPNQRCTGMRWKNILRSVSSCWWTSSPTLSPTSA